MKEKQKKRLVGMVVVVLVLLIGFCGFFTSHNIYAADKKLNVLMMHAACSKGFPDLIGDFEQKTGVKVNLMLSPAKGYDTKAELELAAGGGAYDVIWITWRAYRRWVKKQWVVAINDYIENPKLTDPKEFKFDDFLSGSIRALTIEGKLYGLPILNATQIMYYRKDIFAEYGITSPPRTWKGLLEIAKKIHTPEVGAVAMRGSRARGGVMWPFPQVLYSYGGRITKDFLNDDMHPVFDGPEAVEAAKYYANLLRNFGFKGAESAHWQDVVSAMQQGKAAIMIDGHPLAGQVLDPEKSTVIGKIGFEIVPRGPVTRWPAFACHALGIPKGVKDKELSWEFVKWARSSETQLRNALMHGETALTRKSVLLNPKYMEMFNWGNGEFVYVVTETFDKWLQPFYRPMTPEWGEVEDICGIAMSKILAGEASAEEALREANKKLYKVYKEAGYY